MAELLLLAFALLLLCGDTWARHVAEKLVGTVLHRDTPPDLALRIVCLFPDWASEAVTTSSGCIVGADLGEVFSVLASPALMGVVLSLARLSGQS